MFGISRIHPTMCLSGSDPMTSVCDKRMIVDMVSLSTQASPRIAHRAAFELNPSSDCCHGLVGVIARWSTGAVLIMNLINIVPVMR